MVSLKILPEIIITNDISLMMDVRVQEIVNSWCIENDWDGKNFKMLPFPRGVYIEEQNRIVIWLFKHNNPFSVMWTLTHEFIHYLIAKLKLPSKLHDVIDKKGEICFVGKQIK